MSLPVDGGYKSTQTFSCLIQIDRRASAARSAHQALHALRTGFMTRGPRWVVDVDIRKYFDPIPHCHLLSFLDRRVIDGVIRKMIDKWLKAGVREDGQLRQSTEGSPQGV